MNFTSRIDKQKAKWASLEQRSAPDSIERLTYRMLVSCADYVSGKSSEELERNLATDLKNLAFTTSDPTARKIIIGSTNEFINTTPWDIDLIQ
jgi:hypothetical protein